MSIVAYLCSQTLVWSLNLCTFFNVKKMLAKAIKYIYIYLNNRIDVNKVQTLNLVRLKTMWTFHAFQHTNNFLSHCTIQNKSISLYVLYLHDIHFNINIIQETIYY